jgi:thioredoxin-dependent peroxiredoxin
MIIMLRIHSKAPEFSLPDQNETVHTLQEQEGKWTLIYFYPKDDTPGCTTEACAIRDIFNDYERMGVHVFGVSKDTPASHKAFAEKYGLPFTLLSDEDGEMINAYKAWGEKSWFGKQITGIQRVSYLIGPDLTIVRVYPKVDPASHALEILADLRELIP